MEVFVCVCVVCLDLVLAPPSCIHTVYVGGYGDGMMMMMNMVKKNRVKKYFN